jgi:7-keto-8-aminopelargonate synthetase-like enzyme
VIAASLAAIDVLRNHGPGMRRRLRRHLAAIRKVLTARESGAPETPGPVIAVVPDEPARRERLCRELFRARILPPWIQYPGGPYPGFFRFALSSAHSRAEIDRLAKVLAVQTSA